MNVKIEDENIEFPYKISEGISTQYIALELLKVVFLFESITVVPFAFIELPKYISLQYLSDRPKSWPLDDDGMVMVSPAAR